jgi:hypothetical protein
MGGCGSMRAQALFKQAADRFRATRTIVLFPDPGIELCFEVGIKA